MNEPESIKFLGRMVNGERAVQATEDKAQGMNVGFAIFTQLRWTLKKRDYTVAEALVEIEKAKAETRKKVLHPEVQATALKLYDEMIQKLKGNL